VAKTAILLRWTAYNCKMPDGILAMVDLIYLHKREVVLNRIITEVIAKGTFLFLFSFYDCPGNDKIRIRRKIVPIFNRVPKPSPSQHACESKFAQPFRQRHYRRKSMGRWSANKYRCPKGFITSVVCFVVNTNAPVYLIMHAHFFVEDVVVAVELNAVHT